MKPKKVSSLFLILSTVLLISSSHYSLSSTVTADFSIKIPKDCKEEVSLKDLDLQQLKDLLSRVIADCETEKGKEVPPALVKCYDRICEGSDRLYLDELAEMVPTVVRYVAKENELVAKAPRDDAPAVTASDAIVGKNTCDLTQVVSLLSITKKRIIKLQEILCRKIEDIDLDIFDTKTVLCEKFEQTWTILGDIDFDIFDTKTILCEKIENIIIQLPDIEDDIDDTKTILCAKFEQTWTVLGDIDNDIFDTKTILCAKFDGTFTVLNNLSLSATVDLSGVFTVLNDIDQDIFDTKTILCSKFDQTWTILDNLSVSATVDLSSVFSVLNDIDQDIFDTRTILCDKFDQTWTILGDIDDDIFDTKTVLCAKFDGTFTVLNNLQVSATVDLSSVFTVLNDIDQDIFDTRTILCDKFNQTWTILEDIDDDLLDTKTILCAKFDGTFTVLNNLQVSATVDLSSVFTVLNDIDQDIFDTRTILCDKFDQTWTILADIDEDVFESKTVLCTKFDSTFTVLQLIKNCLGEADGNDDEETVMEYLAANYDALCNPKPIKPVDIGSTTFTITFSGFYVLSDNITFTPSSPQPAIEIAADDVTLDLCGKVLYQGNATAGVDGIVVRGGSAGTPRSNVIVFRGSIKGFSRSGISVGTNIITTTNTAVEMVTLKNLAVVDCDLRGIEFVANSTEANIKKCTIEAVRVLCCCTDASADYALHMINTLDIHIRDCLLNENGNSSADIGLVNIQSSTNIICDLVEANGNIGQTLTGFNIQDSADCLVSNCKILTNDATNSFVVFVIKGSDTEGSSIDNCTAANNTSANGPLRGFELLEGVSRNTLRQCVASNNVVSGAVATANCFGFNLDQVIYCNVLECRAMDNQSTSDGTTNITAGFNVSTSGAGGTGNKNCEIFSNMAVHNNGFNDARSYGFRTISDSGGNENNAYLANTAVRNGPTTPTKETQIVSDAGVGSSPGGVPNASIKDSTLSTLNGSNFEFSNRRII